MLLPDRLVLIKLPSFISSQPKTLPVLNNDRVSVLLGRCNYVSEDVVFLLGVEEMQSRISPSLWSLLLVLVASFLSFGLVVVVRTEPCPF